MEIISDTTQCKETLLALCFYLIGTIFLTTPASSNLLDELALEKEQECHLLVRILVYNK